MKDMFENELCEGNKVIYQSDKFITKIGIVTSIGKYSALVSTNEGYRKQFFNKNSDILPLVIVGQITYVCE